MGRNAVECTGTLPARDRSKLTGFDSYNGKHPPKSSKLLCSPNANRPMTFNIQSRASSSALPFFVQLRIVFQHIDSISYQFQQRAILVELLAGTLADIALRKLF